MEQQSVPNPQFHNAADLLHRILTVLCTQPNELRIAAALHDTKAKFIIVTAPEDVGLVLGRSGHMLRAIREIFQQLSRKDGLVYQIDLADGQKRGGAPAGTTCVHCKCDQEHACVTPTGPCHWWVVTPTRSVCSNPACMQKEAMWIHRN